LVHPAAATVRYWCQDETRLGLKTIQRRRITAKGVKPIGQVQWHREAFYLYGIVEPKTGESFFYEFSHLDSACFAAYLKLVSEQYPQSLNILQLDNSTAHTAKSLPVPDNIVLLFQPPHTPELNPIERLWQQLKSNFAWQIYDNLDQLRVALAEELQNLESQVIASLTGWDYILHALSVAAIS
jgi:transposase